MSSDLAQFEEIGFFRFKSLVPDAKARFVNSKFEESKYGNSTSLLVCSSQYGYFIAGTLEGFVFGQSEHLRDAIDTAEKGQEVEFTNYTEVKAGSVTILSLSVDELQLFVGLQGGAFLVYNIYDIVHQKEEAKPISTYEFDHEINNILPNPTQQDIIAVCLDENSTCHLFGQSSSTITVTLNDTASVGWSPEGNEIMCGCKDGSIKIYDNSGAEKETFSLHDNVKNAFKETGIDGLYVSGIIWVAQDEILVIYSTQPEFNYIFHFNRREITYIEEISGPFSDVYPKPGYHFKLLNNFGPNIQYLVTVLNASSSEITLFGKETGKTWVKWVTESDNGIPEMPLTEDSEDTYPVGVAIDLSVSKPLPPVDPSVSDAPVPPMPIFFFFTTDGVICAYHMYNNVLAEENLKFQGMVNAKGLTAITKPSNTTSSSTTTAGSTMSTLQLSANKPPSGFSFSSAAKTINNLPSSFGTTPGGGTSSFGNSGFGATSFGNTNFGSATPSTAQTVSLASLAKSTPQKQPTTSSSSGFGASSGFGTSSGFGASSRFGTSSGFSASSGFPTSSDQNNMFKPASSGISNNESSSNLGISSSNSTNMFSSEGGGGAKRTAASPECTGFELGGFSKALESDESEDMISTDEEDEDEDEDEEEEEEEEYEEDVQPVRSSSIMKSNAMFAKYEEKEMRPKTYERVAKDLLAKKMEDSYFDTLQEIEQMRSVQNIVQEKLKFSSKTNLIAQHADCFDQNEYQWRLGDMSGITNILDESMVTSTDALEKELKNQALLDNTLSRDDQVYATIEEIIDLIKQEQDEKKDKTKIVKEIAKLANTLIMTPIDLHTFNETLYKELKDKLDRVEPKLASKTPASIPSLYALRQAMRHIDNTLNRCISRADRLSKKDTTPKQLPDHQILNAVFDHAKNLDLVQKTVAK